MADFDWAGTIAAVTSGAPAGTVVVAGTSADGVPAGSYPLGDDGNYQFWVFADPYKATVTIEKGKEIEEVEQDVYETHNLACLCTGAKEDPHFKAQGLRINGVKYTILRSMDAQTFTAKLDDGSAPSVTLEKVFIGKSKDSGLVVGVRGGYYFAAKYKSDPRADPSMAIAERLAIGFYWATGADA